MSSGVNFFKHSFIFEVYRAKLSRVNLQNCISEVYTRGFFSNFKNKAVFEKINTALFLWHALFSQSGSSSNIFLNTFIKKIIDLVPFLSSFWPDLSVSIFLKFQKKYIFCSILALFSKIGNLPLFSRQATLQDKNQCHSINFSTTDLWNGSFWPSIRDGQNETLKRVC